MGPSDWLIGGQTAAAWVRPQLSGIVQGGHPYLSDGSSIINYSTHLLTLEEFWERRAFYSENISTETLRL